jgi:hypothetical protein
MALWSLVTGEGARRSSMSYSTTIWVQSVSSQRVASVAGHDRGLELVGPGALEGGRAGDQPAGGGDCVSVPQRPVLMPQLDDPIAAIEAGGAPGAVQPDQCQ